MVACCCVNTVYELISERRKERYSPVQYSYLKLVCQNDRSTCGTGQNGGRQLTSSICQRKIAFGEACRTREQHVNHNQEGSLGNSSCGDIAYSKRCLGVSPVQARQR